MDKTELFTEDLMSAIDNEMMDVDSTFLFTNKIIEVHMGNGDIYLVTVEKK